MISQENTDERLTETSSSSYEINLTVTSKIKRSTGKKKNKQTSNNICIPAF